MEWSLNGQGQLKGINKKPGRGARPLFNAVRLVSPSSILGMLRVGVMNRLGRLILGNRRFDLQVWDRK